MFKPLHCDPDWSMREFDTARLHLRPLGEGDEPLYCRLYADPRLMRHIAPVIPRETAQRNFRALIRQQGESRFVWVITERATGTQHGILGVVLEGADAEVGVMLLRDGQARGIATEIIPAVADELFQATEVARLWTRHAVSNGPAAALMRNLGFEPSADLCVANRELRWQFLRERWKGPTPDGGEPDLRLECASSQD